MNTIRSALGLALVLAGNGIGVIGWGMAVAGGLLVDWKQRAAHRAAMERR